MTAKDIAAEGFHVFPIDDSLVVVRAGQAGLLLLNTTSRRIWEMLYDGFDVTQIAAIIAADCGISHSLVERDIRNVVANWEISLGPTKLDASEGAEELANGPSSEPAMYDYVIHGRHFRFLISDTDLEEEITLRFGAYASPLDGCKPDFVYELRRDLDGYIIRSSRFSERASIVTEVRIGLVQDVLSACFPEKRFIAALHAAALHRDARCVLLCARTGGGKSTLAAALTASGYSLLSDDLVFLDYNCLDISTIPLSIMLRSGSWNVLEPLLPRLKDVPISFRFGEPMRFLEPSVASVSEGVAPSVLIFLEFEPGEGMQLNELSSFDALVKLNETRSWVDTERHSVARFLSWIQNVPKWSLRYSNLNEALNKIQSLACAQ